jgi:hypothetical protein
VDPQAGGRHASQGLQAAPRNGAPLRLLVAAPSLVCRLVK